MKGGIEMKKYILCVFLLIVICASCPTFATEVKYGYIANWRISPQFEFGLETLMYPKETDHYFLGKAYLLYLPQDEFDIHFLLEAEKDYKDSVIYGGYTCPVNEMVDIHVGLELSDRDNKYQENIFISSDWQTDYGLFGVTGKVGTGEEEVSFGYLYSLENHLMDNVLLKTDVGLKYRLSETSRDLIIPSALLATFDLNDQSRLKLKLGNEYFLYSGQNELELSLFLQNDFGFDQQEKLFLDNSQIIQVETQLVEEDQGEKVEVSQELESTEETLVETEQKEQKEQKEQEEQKEHEEQKEQSEQIEQKEETVVQSDLTQKESTATKTQIYYYDIKTGCLSFEGHSMQITWKELNGEFYLPIRKVVEALEGSVFWENNIKHIYIVFKEKRIILDIKLKKVIYNGEISELNQKLKFFEDHYFMEAQDLINLLSM